MTGLRSTSSMCALALATIATGAQAQTSAQTATPPGAQVDTSKRTDPAAPDANGLADIVVTAEKTKSTEQKTPISMIVRSGDELRRQSRNRIDEIVQDAPGVSVQLTQNGPQLFVRGVGQNAGQPTSTNEQPVALYIDGIYQNQQTTIRGGTLDLERAEILKGPQGTNLGSNSLAGALNLTTATPKFYNEARFTGGYGNLNDRTFEAVGNLKLTDTLAVRAAYGQENRDGYYSNGLNDTDNKTARARIRWQPQQSINLVLTGEYQKIGGYGSGEGTLCDSCDSNGSDTGILHYFRQRRDAWDDGSVRGLVSGKPLGRVDTRIYGVNGNLDIGLGNFATLTVLPAYQDARYYTLGVEQQGSRGANDLTQRTFSTEVRLASMSQSPFSWLVGAYYYHTRITGVSVNTFGLNGPTAPGTPGPPPVCNPGTGYPCETYRYQLGDTVTTKSVFGNVTVPIVRSLRAIGGLRYSHDDKGLVDTNDGNTGFVVGTSKSAFLQTPSGRIYTGSYSSQRLTYRGGLEYDLTRAAMLYATISSGYKSGNIFLQGNSQFAFTQPQLLYQKTVGIKSRFLDNKLQVNLEAFDSFYDNYSINLSGSGVPGGCALNRPSPAQCTQVQNYSYPKLKSRGVDLSVDLLVGSRDRFRTTIAYLDSKFANGGPLDPAVAAAAAANSANPALAISNLSAFYASYSGATLQNSPRWTMNATYEHVFDLGRLGTLLPSVNFVHKTSYYSNFGGGSTFNDVRSIQPTYNLFNLYLSYTTRDRRFEVNAFVKNVGNYPVLINFAGGGAGLQPYADLDLPRQYGASASIHF